MVLIFDVFGIEALYSINNGMSIGSDLSGQLSLHKTIVGCIAMSYFKSLSSDAYTFEQ